MKLKYYPMWYFTIINWIIGAIATFFVRYEIAYWIVIGCGAMFLIGLSACIGYSHGREDERQKLTSR